MYAFAAHIQTRIPISFVLPTTGEFTRTECRQHYRTLNVIAANVFVEINMPKTEVAFVS